MSARPSFFAELKRRNVYKVAVAYAVVIAWLLIQTGSILFPTFEAYFADGIQDEVLTPLASPN